MELPPGHIQEALRAALIGVAIILVVKSLATKLSGTFYKVARNLV